MLPYLEDSGVQATIFTVDPAVREEATDEWMVELAGNKFDKIMVNCLSPKTTRKFGFGDLGFRLSPFLFFTLLKEIKRKKPDMILFPVPPWNTLMTVPLLYRLTGVKYAIDYIDPWVVRDKPVNFKQKFSQWIARSIEKKVVKNASVIFAVSDGINNQLLEDYPFLDKEKLIGVPYGGEAKDFTYFSSSATKSRDFSMIRYVGGIGPDMHEVAKAVLLALKKLAEKKSIRAEFIGTTYAGPGLAKPAMTEYLKDYNLNSIVSEQPERVSYHKAVELSMEADMLLLFGGMKTYYAASKLMGNLLSGKPMVAFTHRHSFPSDFLKQVGFKWLVTYTGEPGDLPEDHVSELAAMMELLLNDLGAFEKVEAETTDLKKYTAGAMTGIFIENMKKYV